MPSGRPWSGARSSRLLFALAALAFLAGNPELEGDDAPGNDGAQVELNGTPHSRKAAAIKIDLGDSKDASLTARPRKKNVIQIDLGDSKDATVEIVRERGDTNVEINGYRVRSHLKQGRRYLFGQEQVLDPPLPPSQFNPDPGGGNLLEPVEPPDLFPPILPQPPEYTGPAPRSLGLPRRGVREMEPERHKLDYEEYPDSESGRGLLPASEPVPNRWFIGFGRWQRYADPRTETPYQTGRLRFWHPYLQSTLKGDAPIIGQDIFLNLTLNDFFQFEARKLPIPSGVSTARPNSSEFFGRSDQLFFSNDFSIGVDLFKGETAFKPVVWALRLLFVANHNYIRVKENNALDPDPRGPGFTAPQPVLTFPNPGDPTSGLGPGLTRLPGDLEGTRYTTRQKDWYALQEAFGEIHIRDLTNNYDFLSSRFGIQPFVSDFRGFIFNDSNLGLRLFGNYDNNRWQYNVMAFDMREKDTYSDLNKFDARDQRIVILNAYRQDFLAKGYTAQLSFHANFDEASRHYDQNDFITRPAPIGEVRDPFSFFVHQGFNLGGTSVNFKQRDSLVIDLRTSKSEGQSNFVNPGTIILGYGNDADITPKLKAFLNVNYIWMAETAVIRDVLFTNRTSNEIGLDCSLGIQYRPLLTNNIIITAGVGFLVPGQGYKDIYRANTNPVFGYPGPSAGKVDDFLYSGILTLTLTY